MTKKAGFEIFNYERYEDNRGHFQEWYHNNIKGFIPVQANRSVSKKFTIRGIHLSRPGIDQHKLISCVTGSILDVIVNLRIGDENFGKFYSVELNSRDSKSIFIYPGMGHAFMALESDTTVVYLTDTNFDPKNEISVNIFDRDIGINWDVLNPIVSEKDLSAISLSEFMTKYSNN